jgi:hypothetical protein
MHLFSLAKMLEVTAPEQILVPPVSMEKASQIVVHSGLATHASMIDRLCRAKTVEIRAGNKTQKKP